MTRRYFAKLITTIAAVCAWPFKAKAEEHPVFTDWFDKHCQAHLKAMQTANARCVANGHSSIEVGWRKPKQPHLPTYRHSWRWQPHWHPY